MNRRCMRRLAFSQLKNTLWPFFFFFTPGATSIEQYCLRRDTWRQVATMSGRRLQFGVAVLDGRLYVVGGRDGLKTLNTVECYNPHSKTWSVMPPMSTHRHGLGERPFNIKKYIQYKLKKGPVQFSKEIKHHSATEQYSIATQEHLKKHGLNSSPVSP